MKKIRQLSFRTQIFLSSMLLVIIPTIVLSTVNAMQRAASITAEYNTSAAATLTQMNQTLDTLIANAVNVADTPLLNDDAGQAMVTNYETDYLSYAQDSTLFRYLMRQTNRLNSTIQAVYFLNRYGYSFEYNLSTAQQRHQIEENINRWADIARSSKNRTYFAPLQTEPSTSRSILPMIRVLLDGYDYRETGLCYAEIDFGPIVEILSSSQETQNMLLIYNADNDLTWSVNCDANSGQFADDGSMKRLSELSAALSEEAPSFQDILKTSRGQFAVNGCINATTGWRLVQVISNEKVTHAYRDTLSSYFGIFLSCILLGLLLAILLSRALTKPVSTLCAEIDLLDASKGGQVDIASCGSNQELRQLILSFNGLSRRLSTSLRENYETQIAEQQMRVQMLQFQINHHFLYNTLNVIKALAGIHEIPEIETIATCMSDLIRYNLEKFPVATLEEELQQVQRYMTIQNIRFPGKFCFDINIPPEFLTMKLPVFLFQPLVENSVEHGFASREGDCYISISCQVENGQLHFLVADNGSGIPADKLAGLQKAWAAPYVNGSQTTSANDPGSINKAAPQAASSVQTTTGKNTKSAHILSDPPASDTLTDRQDKKTAPSHPSLHQENGRKRHRSIGILNVNQRLRSYYGAPYGLSVESMEGEGTIIDIVLPAAALTMEPQLFRNKSDNPDLS